MHCLPLARFRTTPSRAWCLCLGWLLAFGLSSACQAQSALRSRKLGPVALNTLSLEHVHEGEDPHFQGLLIETASPGNAVKYDVDKRDHKWVRVLVLPPDEFAAVFALVAETTHLLAHEESSEAPSQASRTGFGSFCLVGRHQADRAPQEIRAWIAVTDEKTSDYFFTLIARVNDTRVPLSIEARMYLTSYLLDKVFCVSGTRVLKR